MSRDLLDKRKLLEWLGTEINDCDDSYRAGIKWVAYKIEKGTFDDHPAHEEIAAKQEGPKCFLCNKEPPIEGSNLCWYCTYGG